MKYLINLSLLSLIAIFLAIINVSDDNLSIISCDVGQGDATLVQFKNNQILIDGGPDKSVLTCLGEYMPFYDKTIELVILTHPEKDHFGGLIDVFKNYNVGKFATTNRESSSLEYKVLVNEVGGMGLSSIILNNRVNLRLGKIYLDILNPSEEISFRGSNDDGVVILLKYDKFKALFTADVENEVSDFLSTNSKVQNVDYIKVNHHGSKNGLSEKLLQATKPKVAIISVGAKNSYGHPHKEILDLLEKYNVKILRTDQIGNIEIEN
jgi:competence protein ComEC